MRAGVLLIAVAGCARLAAPTPEPADPTLAITSAAELVAPGVVSSEYGEVRLASSPGGKLLVWGSTDRPGGPGGWNLWLSRLGPGGWGAAEPAPFDSDQNDFDPAFSADGRWLYFFSNRPGGEGGDDLYRVRVLADGFGPAEHLGPEVNTPGDEWAPAPSPDGTVLLFASNRPGQKHDLFVAAAKGDGFTAAVPLPGAVNTPEADEFDATFLADGSSLVFSRSPDVEREPITLHFAALRGRSGYGPGVPLPAAVNVPGGYTLGPALDGQDPWVLTFSGKRPEAGRGRLDIYRVRYRLDR